MKQKKIKGRQTICDFCGGQLEQRDEYTCVCTSCGRSYYISAGRTHKVSVKVSAGKMILICSLGSRRGDRGGGCRVSVLYGDAWCSRPAGSAWRFGIFSWRSMTSLWRKSWKKN